MQSKPGASSSGIRQTVKAFTPVYFAMMMASGVGSIAVYFNGRLVPPEFLAMTEHP